MRRSVQPYAAFGLILVALTALMGFIWIKTRDAGALEWLPIGWLFLGAIVFLGSRYRISFLDGVIVQRAFGAGQVRISTDEITKIQQETSNLGTLVRLNRPFRRITIYGGQHRGKVDYIDVSLKHFVREDVRRLMDAIKRHRPDLTTPTQWT